MKKKEIKKFEIVSFVNLHNGNKFIKWDDNDLFKSVNSRITYTLKEAMNAPELMILHKRKIVSQKIPPKSICCNSTLKCIDIQGDGTPGSPKNNLILYCSHCLNLFDGNGYKLIVSNKKIA